jgi:hypothetical protein
MLPYGLFHESFWLAVAASAPIIALANTVTITDAVSTWLNATQRPRPPFAGVLFGVSIIISSLNLLYQAVAMRQALIVLLYERDDNSIIRIYPNIEAFGLIAVLVAVIALVGLKAEINRSKNWQKKDTDAETKKPGTVPVDKADGAASGLGWPASPSILSSRQTGGGSQSARKHHSSS